MSRGAKVALLLGIGALSREFGEVVGRRLFHRHNRPTYVFGVR